MDPYVCCGVPCAADHGSCLVLGLAAPQSVVRTMHAEHLTPGMHESPGALHLQPFHLVPVVLQTKILRRHPSTATSDPPFLCCVLQVPDIWVAMSFVGAVSSTLMGFVLPALVVLDEPPKAGQPAWRRAGRFSFAALVGVLGMGLFVNGMLAALAPMTGGGDGTEGGDGGEGSRLVAVFWRAGA